MKPKINYNTLFVFESVARHLNMTKAATELHLTQSGVSQHISALEKELGFPLFDRMGRRLHLTPQAQELYLKAKLHLTAIESLFEHHEASKEIRGAVTLGAPVEFGINVLSPLIAEFGKLNPKVEFHLKLDFASAMNEHLLKGETDFAFVDEFALDRQIVIEPIYKETLDLCISEKVLSERVASSDGSTGIKKPDRKFFTGLDYVEYQGGIPLLKRWFQHHLGFEPHDLKVRATVMDAQAVARLITEGLGAGILPHHLTQKLKSEKYPIHVFKKKDTAVINQIRLAYLREKTLSATAKTLIDFLKKRLEKYSA